MHRNWCGDSGEHLVHSPKYIGTHNHTCLDVVPATGAPLVPAAYGMRPLGR